MVPRRTGAFTLIELLVVILIIAVVAATIVPAFAGFYDKARFDGEIRRVQDYFALAREKAVRGDTTVTLHFEPGTHRFSMVIDPQIPQNDLPTAMLTADSASMAQGQDVAPYRVADDCQVENFTATSASTNASGPAASSQSDVQFRGDGTSDRAAFEMISRQGYTANLALSPTDGRLTLQIQTGRGGE